MYDAHGNMVATLSRSGSGYAVADRRSYDAWGAVRSQQSGGDPKMRYCASLGHRQDDESGLVYMRARYYEPTSERFLSEDPGRHGANWFIYCDNQPNIKTDPTGKVPMLVAAFIAGFIAGAAFEFINEFSSPDGFDLGAIGKAGLLGGATGALLALGGTGLVALGGWAESAFITSAGEGLLAISTGFSPKNLAGAMFGATIGGVAGGVLNLEVHVLQIQALLDADTIEE